jgi:uncharacterized protein YjbJ (UPF0337 family)
MTNESEGKKDEAVGRLKEAAGALTDDDELRAEGQLDQLAGRIKGKASELIDEARERVGKALGRDDDEERGSGSGDA